MKRYSLKIKEIELQLHEGNYNRRVSIMKKILIFLLLASRKKLTQ